MNKQNKINKIKVLCEKYSNQVVWMFSLLIILSCAVFLYNNFYKTISDVKFLMTLKSQVASEAVDMGLWKKINQAIEWKKQRLGGEDKINNPF